MQPAARADAYRVAFLTSHPIQYQAPLFRALAASPALDLTVMFLSRMSPAGYYDQGFGVRVAWDVPLLEGYRHEFLPGAGAADRLSFFRPIVHGLTRRLRAGRYDALCVMGYGHIGYLRAIAVAKILGLKVFLYGDSNLEGWRRSRAILALKRFALPALFRMCDGLLATATPNRDYYLHYGVAAQKIFFFPWTVDNDFFRRAAIAAHADRDRFRAGLGLDADRPVILYASKLQRHKRPGDLLEAYARLASAGGGEPRPYLLFVGDGEERPRLERRTRELGWNSIRFLGFRNQTELPAFFDLCDALVLVSEREGVATIVAEVMNAGKPVIVTRAAGLAHDLVEEGVNGYFVPVGDIEAIADRLRMIASDPERAAAMGARSLERIAQWSYAANLRGLLAALDATVVRRS
ncbi:MAG: glycosyltransferase family 4 protein [Candidatus Binataceae bacterium]|nr:glycosyltransferase family 4 protein [Candidatus Binataceae bacterium]